MEPATVGGARPFGLCPGPLHFEGIVEDVAHGHVPNVLGEMGIRSELRYNPGGLVRKAVIATAVVGVFMALRNRRRSH